MANIETEEKDTIHTYCVMCCCDYEHYYDEGEGCHVCGECGSALSSGISDRDETIDELNEKTEKLTSMLLSMGVSQEEIDKAVA